MTEVKNNDLVWEMKGVRQNDKIHWEAIPKVVKIVDERKFLFYSGGGGSLGLIGKRGNYPGDNWINLGSVQGYA